jgi:hypothetical protein
MNASDADEGENARVTYTPRRSIGGTVCSDVKIDANTADVTLSSTPTQSETCSVIVDACDNPLELSQQ